MGSAEVNGEAAAVSDGAPWPAAEPRVTVEHRCADPDKRTAFSEWAETLFSVMSAFAELAGVPDLRVHLVLADDFAGEVTSRLGLEPGAPFTTERLGGTAIGKNLELPDADASVIVLDASVLAFDAPEAAALAAYLMLHEMAHSVFRLLRRRSSEPTPAATLDDGPEQIARSMVRAAVEEYRADRLAAGVLDVGQWFSVTDENGNTRPWQPSDSLGGLVHRAQVASVLDENVYPGWPDAVWAYRTHRLALDDLWQSVVTWTDQLLTLLAHAEAEADGAGMPGPLAAECSDHPGSRIYVGPTWTGIRDVMAEQLLVPDLPDFAQQERDLLDAGQRAVLEMWARLGVRPSLTPDGQLFIAVDDPTW
jgi:hypothetical protein